MATKSNDESDTDFLRRMEDEFVDYLVSGDAYDGTPIRLAKEDFTRLLNLADSFVATMTGRRATAQAEVQS